MSKPLHIGITGGIGSGKSLISKIFHCLGVPVYDADSRAKYVMTTDGILIDDIKKEFGELSFEGSNLNRNYISKIVFQNPAKLARLNELVHPRVGEDYKKWVNENSNYPYVLKEAALMFESGSYKIMDKVIFVSAGEELRIKRVLKRDPQRTRSQVEDIIKNQMPDSEKIKLADFVTTNDETELIIPQVLNLDKQFKALYTKNMK
jgi:dephospho-CoA kinase